jgi:hypothetical protein
MEGLKHKDAQNKELDEKMAQRIKVSDEASKHIEDSKAGAAVITTPGKKPEKSIAPVVATAGASTPATEATEDLPKATDFDVKAEMAKILKRSPGKIVDRNLS